MNSTKKANPNATDAREAVLRGPNRPAINLGLEFSPEQLGRIPEELRQQARWLSWVWIKKAEGENGHRWAKLPQRLTRKGFVAGYSFHDESHTATLLPLDELAKKLVKADPDGSSLGLMFSPHQDGQGRSWVAIDIDGFTFDRPEELPEPLRAAYVAGAGYWCNSPSGHGLRIVGYVNDGRPVRGGTTTDGIGAELKIAGCPTITTDSRIDTATLNITTFWRVFEGRLPDKPKRREYQPAESDPMDNDSEWMGHLTKAAESYVLKMEEAVEGSRGHDSLFRVCCRIAGGFGLRGDEGFDLAALFNQQRSQPPFSEADLLHKWNNALRATEGEAATLREKPLATFKKLQARKTKRAAAKFAGYTTSEAPREDAGAELRGCPFASPAGASGQPESPDDSTPNAGHDEPSESMDGPKERGSAGDEQGGEQAHAKRAMDGRWIILHNEDRHDQMLDQLARHLANQPEQKVFQRNGRAHVVVDVDVPIRFRHPDTGEVITRGVVRKGICPAERGHLMPIVAKAVAFRRMKVSEDGEKVQRAVGIPGGLLNSLQNSPAGLPPLRGLLFGPVYDQETDTVLNSTGYHPGIGMVQTGEVPGLRVPDRVTQEDAWAAAERVLHPFRFFPWPKGHDVSGCVHRGRLLMALLTAVQRWSFFQCPLMILRGKSAGTGKTTVASAISEIAHGAAPRLMPWVKGQNAGEELRKRIIGLLDAGEQYAVFDNLPIGHTVDEEALCALATSPKMLDRMMGRNDGGAQVGGENRLFLVLTGNNIQPANDAAERFLVIDFDAPAENRRKLPVSAFGDVGELVDHVRAHRSDLLADLLTILRGYQQAGRPDVGITPWGSFSDWVDKCGKPAVWALGYDPLISLHDEWTENSTEGAGLIHLADEWVRHYPGQAFTAKDLLTICTPANLTDHRKPGLGYNPDFGDALASACDADDVLRLGSRWVGRRLKAFAGKPAKRGQPRVAGRRIDLGDAGAWCLMVGVDRAENQALFTIEPFETERNGPKDHHQAAHSDPENSFRNTGTPEHVPSGEFLNGVCTQKSEGIGPDGVLQNVGTYPVKKSGVAKSSRCSGVPAEQELIDRLDHLTTEPVPVETLLDAWKLAGLPVLWLVQNIPIYCTETPNGLLSNAVAEARRTGGKA